MRARRIRGLTPAPPRHLIDTLGLELACGAPQPRGPNASAYMTVDITRVTCPACIQEYNKLLSEQAEREEALRLALEEEEAAGIDEPIPLRDGDVPINPLMWRHWPERDSQSCMHGVPGSLRPTNYTTLRENVTCPNCRRRLGLPELNIPPEIGLPVSGMVLADEPVSLETEDGPTLYTAETSQQVAAAAIEALARDPSIALGEYTARFIELSGNVPSISALHRDWLLAAARRIRDQADQAEVRRAITNVRATDDAFVRDLPTYDREILFWHLVRDMSMRQIRQSLQTRISVADAAKVIGWAHSYMDSHPGPEVDLGDIVSGYNIHATFVRGIVTGGGKYCRVWPLTGSGTDRRDNLMWSTVTKLSHEGSGLEACELNERGRPSLRDVSRLTTYFAQLDRENARNA